MERPDSLENIEEFLVFEDKQSDQKEKKSKSKSFSEKQKIIFDEPIKAEKSLYKKRQLATRSDIKKIQKSAYRYEGKKVVTDDVKKLKSLEVVPEIPLEEKNDYYVEPVWIEYYVPKDSRFITELRYLYIPLIDPPFDDAYPILNEAMRKNQFLDVVGVLNEYPEFTTVILESYQETLHFHERISLSLKEVRHNPDAYKTAFYVCETIMKFEPTLAYLEVLGDYISWNLNWLIRKLNSLQIEFYAEDDTVAYLIKRRNMYWEENQLPYEERFEILAALFFEQAYPNRGLTIEEQDFYYNIFR